MHKMRAIFGLMIVLPAIGLYLISQHWIARRALVCTHFDLDDRHLILNQSEIPERIGGKMRSPLDGSELELIVIDPDDPEMMDEPWRHAYYSPAGDMFWIADMWGFGVRWYGPYEGSPCLLP